ncbi:MAG: heme exporter protein CcmB [Alphaproteobacteria bacterium]|nr:heme exporter protein CcmB [Alphaproteobacteria bacterium]
MNAMRSLIGRDLRLALRSPQESLTVLAFFAMAAVLFPFGVGPEPQLLARVASGVLWVMALLAALLSFERLFQLDHEDGTLDLIVLAPAPLELLVLAKCIAHWLTTGLPLIVIAPVAALMLNLPPEGIPVLLLSLLLGTPTLSLLGAIGAALVLGARRGGVLLPLLVMPLYIPILIFGVSAIEASIAGLTPRPHLLLLAAIQAGAIPLAAIAAAAALRQAAE